MYLVSVYCFCMHVWARSRERRHGLPSDPSVVLAKEEEAGPPVSGLSAREERGERGAAWLLVRALKTMMSYSRASQVYVKCPNEIVTRSPSHRKCDTV